jgi:hypothetical protein
METLYIGVVEKLKNAICSLPSGSAGLGADLYAGVGTSLAGEGSLDVSTGELGVNGNLGVGVGLNVGVGPYVGVSGGGTGRGWVSGNLTTSVGGGVVGIGGSITRSMLGTNKGELGATAGKAELGAFGNVGAQVGFKTPPLYNLGCKS